MSNNTRDKEKDAVSYCETCLAFFVVFVIGLAASWWSWRVTLSPGWFFEGGIYTLAVVSGRFVGTVFALFGLYLVPATAWYARQELKGLFRESLLAYSQSTSSSLEWLEGYVGRVSTPSDVLMDFFVAWQEKFRGRPELHSHFLTRVIELRREHANLDRAWNRAEGRMTRE